MNSTNTSEGRIDWRCDIEAVEWDRMLAELGGHPLQSALWGQARREVDGIRDHRWVAMKDNCPIFMIRIEERRLPGFGWVGWAPKGPVGYSFTEIFTSATALWKHLTQLGMILLVTDRWETTNKTSNDSGEVAVPQTIWLDLTLRREQLWRNLDTRIRYGVKKATKNEVVVTESVNITDIEYFEALCVQISKKKGFHFSASRSLLKYLLAAGGEFVEAKLILANKEQNILGGAFLIRCGTSVHYFWGGVDRSFPSGVGEAVQWGAIEWALGKNCRCYDLEGIDPIGNPGVYAFKKKMGGRIVSLVAREYFPADIRGCAFAWISKLQRR